MSQPALVFCEHDEEGLLDSSLRAVTFARSLGGEVALACCGSTAPVVAGQAGEFGAGRLFEVALDGYAPLAHARALLGLAEEIGAGAVVAAGTEHGHEVLAHLAALGGEEMVANCVAAARPSQGVLSLRRQRWGGSLLEDARLAAPRALLTVASDAVPPVAAPSPAPPALERYQPRLEEGDEKVRALERVERSGGVSLANARVVVSGGRGVGGPEGFAAIEELAGLLGGAVGVSRAVTSLGWRPHKEQVGQTGTRVTPELYLACGISGAIQHLAGCQSAKTMVAINTDPDAPIMGRADYAVIGDVAEVLPALVEAIRERAPRS